MKWFIRMIVATGLSAAAVGCNPSMGRADTPSAASPTTRPVAVVELFTSEGCSSCPPADAAIADIAKDARTDGSAVYTLSFHVDYWNHLGWKDRFSDAAYSKRQQTYAQALGDSSVYTPEAVVNGHIGFVGSNRDRLKQEIATALKTNAAAVVELKITADRDGQHLIVDYKLTGVPAGSVFNVAAVERDLTTEVRAGENGGRTLKHTNVVRSFDTHAIDSTNAAGQVTLALPEGALTKNIAVVGYVQDNKTMQITGVSASDVPAR